MNTVSLPYSIYCIKLKLVLCFFLSALGLSARTWIARDGRTLNAELVEVSDNAVLLRRDDTKQVVVVPFTSLSEADVVEAKNQATVIAAKLAIQAKTLESLLKDLPPIGSNLNDAQQLYTKYVNSFRSIRINTIEANLKIIRSSIKSDLDILTPISQTKPLAYDSNGRPIRSVEASNPQKRA